MRQTARQSAPQSAAPWAPPGGPRKFKVSRARYEANPWFCDELEQRSNPGWNRFAPVFPDAQGFVPGPRGGGFDAWLRAQPPGLVKHRSVAEYVAFDPNEEWVLVRGGIEKRKVAN